MIEYRFKHKETGEYLCYDKQSNEGKDFCGEYSVELSEYGDDVWTTESLDAIIYATVNDTKWYNSSREFPSHGSIDINEYKIVKVEIKEKCEDVDCKIPSILDVLEAHYDKQNNRPHFLLNIQKPHSEGREIICDYSLWLSGYKEWKKNQLEKNK